MGVSDSEFERKYRLKFLSGPGTAQQANSKPSPHSKSASQVSLSSEPATTQHPTGQTQATNTVPAIQPLMGLPAQSQAQAPPQGQSGSMPPAWAAPRAHASNWGAGQSQGQTKRAFTNTRAKPKKQRGKAPYSKGNRNQGRQGQAPQAVANVTQEMQQMSLNAQEQLLIANLRKSNFQ